MVLTDQRSTRFLAGILLITALSLAGCDGVGSGGDEAPPLPPSVIAVDADASGEADGATWDTAYPELQPALESAEPGDEIWVAEGTYVPSRPTDAGDERTATFQIEDDVDVYGGFTGDERERSARDPSNNAAVLSGDLGQDGDAGNNSYHVVTVREGAETTLSGLIISDGFANGEDVNVQGGGIVHLGGRLALEQVQLSNNAAGFGGGLFLDDGTARLTEVVLETNEGEASGGGAYVDEEARTRLENVRIADNTAQYGGGLTTEGDLTVYDSEFAGNTARTTGDEEDADGGAVLAFGGQSFTNVRFQNNEAEFDGGALFLSGSKSKSASSSASSRAAVAGEVAEKTGTSAAAVMPPQTPGETAADARGNGGGLPGARDDGASAKTAMMTGTLPFLDSPPTESASTASKASTIPSFENCTFEGNQATYGGAIYNFYTDAYIQDSDFANNVASESGGGMYDRENESTLSDVEFRGNEAVYGGGLYEDATISQVIDGTFVGNRAEYGGAIAQSESTTNHVNVLLYDNRASRQGGAIAGYDSGANYYGVTATQNDAQNGGGALRSDGGGSFWANSILWANGSAAADDEVVRVNGGDPQFYFAFIEGSGGSSNWNSAYGSDLVGNRDRDPEFVNPSDDDFHLRSTSPGIDHGSEVYATDLDDTDLDDGARVADGDDDGEEEMDVGAYEYE